ncbi:MAG: hypothetical protein AVO35_06760 [Candidatus Aegiribacteria sp. MLS_C]|nr:MAG: hypothetical protein AVO35_06760 [Candidatus Aegiribacteria sp. MLS_C]
MESLSTSLPGGPENWRDAAGSLLERLQEDGVYHPSTMASISVSEEAACAPADCCDTVIREVHGPGGEGDPNTAPVLDRFRVCSRCGGILWWHPLRGEYMPHSSLLKRTRRGTAAT